MKCSLLDIGGGGGGLAKCCLEQIPDSEICIVDPSLKQLYKQRLKGVKLVQGKLPDDLNVDATYNFVAIREVLHHIVGSSIRQSKEMVKRSLLRAKERMEDEGFLFVNEIYYESPFIQSLSRTLIFYLLKVQNRLGIKVPSQFFLEGLEVCFYTRDELRSFFDECDLEIVDYHHFRFRNNIYSHVLLLKGWGYHSYVLKKNRDDHWREETEE